MAKGGAPEIIDIGDIMSEKSRLFVKDDEKNLRLDSFLTIYNPGVSRSRIQKIIDEGLVKVNNVTAKKNHRLKPGSVVDYSPPVEEELVLTPEALPLDILYEDREIIVVNKPQGMVVHPAPGNPKGTLVHALLHHYKPLANMKNHRRPGIVHRLDKDTSGVMVVAKNDAVQEALINQIKRRGFKRIYVSLLHGLVAQDRGIIDAPIGRDPLNRKRMTVIYENSKNAITHFRVIERLGSYTFMELELKTGRTHQIRVHMSHLKHPVVGDTKYGRGRNNLGFKSQALHAKILGFKHPKTGNYMEFETGPPEHFMRALDYLGYRGKGDKWTI